MARPPKCRCISGVPNVTCFIPQGIPIQEGAEVRLALEGLEALRLADLEGMSQEESARHMGISRPTFGRILAEARKTVAQALIKGMVLQIQGGVCMVVRRQCCSNSQQPEVELLGGPDSKPT